MNNESYIKKMIEEGIRSDERKFDELRHAQIKTGIVENADGSAEVRMGDTRVLVGVKMGVGTPFPDSPDEGILMVGAELAPISSQDFEPGPPSERAIEVARVIDRGIRECKAIELGKLCIKPGELVWIVNIDIHVLDHGGNLIDAGGLAAIAALLHTRLPKLNEDKIVFGEFTKEKLPVVDTPIPVTICKIGEKIFVDPILEEEDATDARITITSTKEGNLCSIQKGGTGYFTKDEVMQAAELSIKKGKELRTLLKQ